MIQSIKNVLTGSFVYCWKAKKTSKNILTNMVSANQLSQQTIKKIHGHSVDPL